MTLRQMANPKEKSKPGLTVTLKLSAFFVRNSMPSRSWQKHPRDVRNIKMKVNFKYVILHTLKIGLSNSCFHLKL